MLAGFLGHISKTLTQNILAKGHAVTVISSNQECKREIEVAGATAAMGLLEDIDFLISSFTVSS